MAVNSKLPAIPRWLQLAIAVGTLLGMGITLGVITPGWASKDALTTHEAKAQSLYQTKEDARREHRDLERRQQQTLQQILEAIQGLKKDQP